MAAEDREVIVLPVLANHAQLAVLRDVDSTRTVLLPLLKHFPQPTTKTTTTETEPQLSQNTLEIMAFAMSDLGLPLLAACHLAHKNRDRDLFQIKANLIAQYGQPNEDVQAPAVVALGGLSNMGKSILATAIAHQNKPEIIQVVSLAGFSSIDYISLYTDILNQAGLLNNQPLDIKAAVAAINQYWQQNPKNNSTTEKWNLNLALDKFCKLFENGNRPPIVVVDMPGLKLPQPGQTARPTNVFDDVWRWAVQHITPERLEAPEVIASSPIVDEETVIQNYLRQFDKLLPDLILADRLRTGVFWYWLAGDDDESWDYYLDWRTIQNQIQDKISTSTTSPLGIALP
ncbi:MAG: hypothetical protein WCV93_01400 [Candidatus Shapirobacteria bacterium]|jgi:hypothetical protein